MMQNHPRRASVGVAGWLWGVAYAALGLGAAAASDDVRGVTGVALGGALLWGVALLADFSRGRTPSRPARLLTLTLLAGAGIAEAIAATFAASESQEAQTAWFGMAVGFALAGIVSARRREPSDGVLLCQIFFHGLMLFPALAQLAELGLNASGSPSNAAPLTRLLVIVAGVALPLLVTTLLAILAHDVGRPESERDRPAIALLAAQAAYVVAVFRWAQDGL